MPEQLYEVSVEGYVYVYAKSAQEAREIAGNWSERDLWDDASLKAKGKAREATYG